MTGPIAASRLSTWRIVNVGTVERVGRIAVGVAATIATGHCPPYQRLGRAPGQPKSTP